ncbi:hypothetical protein [Flavobacterium sp.]|uniref:hypothetical protein n=1 Tax=Flavobacterium sp. TaxID=239 RepID=UPI003D6AF6F1
MKRKYIFIIGGLLLFLFCFYKLGSAFAPGSYANAESYELNYPEKKVIEAAEKVRKDNIYLHVGEGWEDKDSTDYWHHIYFNFHNRMLLTWTRPSGKNNTTFAFVRIQDSNSEWKDLNSAFGYFENRKIKKALEEEILAKMKIELEKKQNK